MKAAICVYQSGKGEDEIPEGGISTITRRYNSGTNSQRESVCTTEVVIEKNNKEKFLTQEDKVSFILRTPKL